MVVINAGIVGALLLYGAVMSVVVVLMKIEKGRMRNAINDMNQSGFIRRPIRDNSTQERAGRSTQERASDAASLAEAGVANVAGNGAGETQI